MPSHLSNPWNQSVCLLQMRRGKEILGTGTCFFWSKESSCFLVTNWHNLAGRDPITGNGMKGIPDRIRFFTYKRISEPDAHGLYEMLYVPVEVEICNPDLTNPRWLEHPLFGRRVDIAAIEVTSVVEPYEIKHVNTLERDAVLHPVASQEVFVVGFPFGAIPSAPAPIWKRGTIALDPAFDPEGLPKMLIDTATREGMSGSVVIARHIVVGRAFPKKDGTNSEAVLYASIDLVVGIYSGRHYPDLDRAQLGIVWKRSAIEETVAGMHLATV